MLEVYIEESEDDHTFAVGGVAASPEQWKAFVPSWTFITNGNVKEVQESKSRPEIVGRLPIEIYEHVQFICSCVVRKSDIDLIPSGSEFFDLHRRPYVLCLFSLVAAVIKRAAAGGEQLKFVFDRRSDERKVLANWGDFLAGGPPQVRDYVLGEPRFLDDETCLPLQAAHVAVGWSRLRFTEMLTGAVPTPRPPIREMELPHVLVVLTPEEIKNWVMNALWSQWPLTQAKA